MEKFFKLNEKGSNVKTELIAGLTTFLAMAYILGVNPAVLADAGMDKASVFLATAISAGVASIIMGLVNFPQFLYIYANKHPVVLSQRVFFYDSFNACTILLTLSM